MINKNYRPGSKRQVGLWLFGLLVVLLTFLLVSADSWSIRLVRLTIVNKSGLPLEIRLTNEEDENLFYYLRLEEGDRILPSEQVFTIIPGTYTIEPYYIELWDPVYGYSCGEAGSTTLRAEGNIKITFRECDRTIRNVGEPSIWKWSSNLKYIY